MRTEEYTALCISGSGYLSFPLLTYPLGQFPLPNNSPSLLPRDAMHSADYAIARCLSVTRRYFVETVMHILKPFHHRVAILVFARQTAWQYSDATL